MKKFCKVLILVIFISLLAACGDTSSSSSSEEGAGDFPNKPITIIVSFAAGGGMDTGTRILQPYLEDELGVPVTIENKPGAGGWVGWNELVKADPDGYTLSYLGTPNILTGYLDPNQKRDEDLESFDLIAKHIVDNGVIAVNKDEDRFTTIEELIEYAQENQLTSTSTGVASDDHIASLNMNNEFGTKFIPVHTEGSAKQVTDVLGGHVDVLFGNVGDIYNLHQNDEINVLAVMAEERSEFLEGVPTLKESGFEGVTSSASRGYAGPAGIDDERMKILNEAFMNAIKNQEQVESQAKSGLQVDPKGTEEYKEELQSIEDNLKSLSELLGW